MIKIWRHDAHVTMLEGRYTGRHGVFVHRNVRVEEHVNIGQARRCAQLAPTAKAQVPIRYKPDTVDIGQLGWAWGHIISNHDNLGEHAKTRVAENRLHGPPNVAIMNKDGCGNSSSHKL